MTVEKCSNVIVNFMFFDLFPAIRVLINAGWRAAWPPRHCHRTCQIHTNQHMNLKCLGHFKFIGQINWTEILPTSFRTKWFGLCIIIINLIIIIIVYNSLLFFFLFFLCLKIWPYQPDKVRTTIWALFLLFVSYSHTQAP